MQYISNTEADRKVMLDVIGVKTFDELVSKIPSSLRGFHWDIPKGVSEVELLHELVDIGRTNRHFHDVACYLGGGNYDHFIPTVVGALAHRSEFITSYTPYQGEASQGTLQFIYEYQSLICELTGMDYSNASMYDGASSLAEAALLALRSTGRRRILIPETVHPEYRQVTATYLSALDCELVTIPMKDFAIDVPAVLGKLGPDVAAVVYQQPNFFGALEDPAALIAAAKKAGSLVIACVNPIALGVLQTPGEAGADIAVGEGQPLGNPVSFGGPHFGFFTVKEDLLRKIPGRIAGMTVDRDGKRAFVLTLQAREQHIRREKATSNICTNHSLCALKAAIYMSLLGPQGMKKLSILNLDRAEETRCRLLGIPGVRPLYERPFFNEFGIWIDRDPSKLRESLRKNRIVGPLSLADFYPSYAGAYLVAVTENRSEGQLNRLEKAIREVAS